MACVMRYIAIVAVSLTAAVTTSVIDENKCSKFDYEYRVLERIIFLENKNVELERKQVVLERKNEELGDRLKEQRLELERVSKEQDQDQEKLRNNVEKIETDWPRKNATHVSFSARLGHNKKYTSPETLVFKTVLNNDGDAYDVNTGIFTAPVDGKYWFSASISLKHQAYADVRIMKNNIYKVLAYPDRRGDSNTNYETATVSTVMDLVAGDTAYCRWYSGTTSTQYSVSGTHVNSFSGTLLSQFWN